MKKRGPAILALIALRNRDRIVKEQLQRLTRNVEILDRFFAGRSGTFAWNRPGGGSVCFPRMLSVEDTQMFCKKLVAEAGILLAPSGVFQYGDKHVRIGFGREDLPEVLKKFGDYLDNNL